MGYVLLYDRKTLRMARRDCRRSLLLASLPTFAMYSTTRTEQAMS
jgi:hypothetical protein